MLPIELLETTHVGVDGEAYPVDASRPANAFTSKLRGTDHHALLVDIDSPWNRSVDGTWLLEASQLPGLYKSLPSVLEEMGLLSRCTIQVPYLTAASHTPGHQHLFLFGTLTQQQLILAHSALTCAGVESWGNLFQVVRRGYSVLYFPGAKATRPGRNSGGKHAAH